MLWHPVQRGHGDRLGARLVAGGVLESAETWARVREEAARVLAQCLPPDAPCGRRTGVILGSAQSSETLSMTAVAALARDNGFRIVVALTGTAEAQFKHARDGFESALVVGAPPPQGWAAWANPTPHRDAEAFAELVHAWGDPRIAADQQPALFVSVLRHPVRLDQLAKLLETQDLSGVSVLVLDDETDSAGPGANPLAADPISTHGSIQRVRDALPRHTCLQYSAAANPSFLITLLDMLSPDFADVLESGDDYCGGRAFFLERSDLAREIPDLERPDVVVGSPEPPGSLLHALRVFLLGVALEGRRKAGLRRTMLVHPQHRSDAHRAYREWIGQALQRIGGLLARTPGDRERQRLAMEFELARQDLAATNGPMPPLEELLIALSIEVPRIVVTEVESATAEEVRWDEAFTHVLIGGQRLAGGHVLRGLTVTYMPKGRGASMPDMIEQRARFLGYRRSYLGLCRVFLQHDLARLYREHAQHEAHVRAQVVAHRGRATRDLRRTLILDARSQPSSAAIATQPFFRTQKRGWFKQRMPHVASAMDLNIRRVESFLSGRRWSRHVRYSHRIATAPLTEVIELLGRYAFGPEELLEAQIFIDQLIRIREVTPEAQVSVHLMQPDPRFRTTRSESDDTLELHEPRAESDLDGYPGDAALRDAARVTLQVHWLRVSRRQDGAELLAAARVPALAIHIPQGL